MTRSAYHPEGRQAKSDTRRSDYEEAGGKKVFQWQPGAPLQVSDWTNKGGLGSPQRLFGDFLCVQKVTRVRGGEPRKPCDEAARFGCARVPGAEPPTTRTEVPGQAGFKKNVKTI